MLYGTRYTDLCYGYNAFRRECLDLMRLPAIDLKGEDGAMLWGDGFEVETLINVRIAKAGLEVTEVPSFETERQFGASNLNAFSDGIRVLRTIHSERKGARRMAARNKETVRKAAGRNQTAAFSRWAKNSAEPAGVVGAEEDTLLGPASSGGVPTMEQPRTSRGRGPRPPSDPAPPR